MNCFNIREVESLLKGRFFPDLINSQDHHVLMNNSIIGIRFKTNDLDSINHNTLLSNQFALFSKTDKRFTFFLLENTESVNNFKVYNSSSFFKKSTTVLEDSFLKTNNIFSNLLVDFHLYLTSILSANRPAGPLVSRNAKTFLNLPGSTVTLFKNLVERQALISIY